MICRLRGIWKRQSVSWQIANNSWQLLIARLAQHINLQLMPLTSPSLESRVWPMIIRDRWCFSLFFSFLPSYNIIVFLYIIVTTANTCIRRNFIGQWVSSSSIKILRKSGSYIVSICQSHSKSRFCWSSPVIKAWVALVITRDSKRTACWLPNLKMKHYSQFFFLTVYHKMMMLANNRWHDP